MARVRSYFDQVPCPDTRRQERLLTVSPSGIRDKSSLVGFNHFCEFFRTML